MTNDSIGKVLESRAQEHPQRCALITPSGEEITYESLNLICSKMAQYLKGKGISAGDRVYIGVPPNENLFITLIALMRLAAIPVIVESAMAREKWAPLFQREKIKIGVFSGVGKLIPWMRPGFSKMKKIPLISRKKLSHNSWTGVRDKAVLTDPGLVSFTSGTTGLPKARVRTQGFLINQSKVLSNLLPAGIGPSMVFLPGFVLHNLAVGRPSLIPNFWPLDILKFKTKPIFSQMNRYQPEKMLCSPGILVRLCDSKHSGSISPREILTGGGQVSTSLVSRVHHRFPGSLLTIVYGSTEAEPISHIDSKVYLNLMRQKPFHGLPVGKPDENLKYLFLTPENQFNSVGPGELLISGPQVNPEVPPESWLSHLGNQYYRTGDMGRSDSDGLWFLGRAGEQFRYQNKTWYPLILEQALEGAFGKEKAPRIAVLEGESEPWVIHTKTELDLRAHAKEAFSGLEGLDQVRLVSLDFFPLDPRHRTKILKNQLRILAKRKVDQDLTHLLSLRT